MARGISRKELKQDEFAEAVFDLGNWFEENWKKVLLWGGIILVAGVVVAGYFGWQQHRTGKALAVMELGTEQFRLAAISQFSDIDALASALAHFEEAEAMAGASTPGPLASYYRGVTLHRLGRQEEAIEALVAFVAQAGGDQPLDWAGRALLAELYVAGAQNELAITLLTEVTQGESAYPRDQALIQLGTVHQRSGDADAARAAWQRVVDEFPGSLGARRAGDLLGS